MKLINIEMTALTLSKRLPFRLVDKDLEDANFTGIEHIIKCLTRQEG
jgi:hypothetical protein